MLAVYNQPKTPNLETIVSDSVTSPHPPVAMHIPSIATHRFLHRVALYLCVFVTLNSIGPGRAAEPEVDFAREIQPILANHCWSCHGPDETSRQADLRLDIRDQATAKSAIIAGDSEKSSLIERINSTDAEQVMPPPASKKPITEHQKEL